MRRSPYVRDNSYVLAKQAWTTTPAFYDIVANGPGGMYPCRRIVVQTAGTLSYKDLNGTPQGPLTCFAGEVLDLEATTLEASSTAQGVKVYW